MNTSLHPEGKRIKQTLEGEFLGYFKPAGQGTSGDTEESSWEGGILPYKAPWLRATFQVTCPPLGGSLDTQES